MADRGAPALAGYESIVGQAEIGALRAFARPLQGRRVMMVDAAITAGGAGEMLNRLVLLLNDLGVETRHERLTGTGACMAAMRAVRRGLGGGTFVPEAGWTSQLATLIEHNRKRIVFDTDIVVVHDPEPAPLVEARQLIRASWLWRCHVDLSRPDPEAWDFLLPYVSQYDAAIVSSPSSTERIGIPEYVVAPTVDPLSDRNRELDPDAVTDEVMKFGIDPGRPILTQVSRFDHLADPALVIEAYRLVRQTVDCQLVLAGASAADEPAALAALAHVRSAAGQDPDIHVLNLPPASQLAINVLQRAATVVVQQGVREGFGLRVCEALWKSRPVVVAAAGSPAPVIDNVTGLVAQTVEDTALQLVYLLTHPDVARGLGESGHQHVRGNLLVTHTLKRYLLMFLAASRFPASNQRTVRAG